MKSGKAAVEFSKAVWSDLVDGSKNAGRLTGKVAEKAVDQLRHGTFSAHSAAFNLAAKRLLRSGLSAENLILRLRELEEQVEAEQREAQEEHPISVEPGDA